MHVSHRTGYSEHPVTRAMGADLKLEARRKDGSQFPVEISLSPGSGNRVTAIVRDISRRKQIERRFMDLLDSAPDAILEIDHSGRIILVNRMTERLFGYSREEVVGHTIETLVPESVRAGHGSHRANYFAQPVTRPMGAGLNLEARRKDGSHFPVEISLSPANSESGSRVIAIVRDVTDRKQMEAELQTVQQKYIRELELKNIAAEQANRLKTEFLANMSHELRSPLHTIIGFAELLAEQNVGPLNEAQQRFIGYVHKDSTHLLDLINDLLDLSKIEAERLDLKLETVEIAAVIEEALASVRPRAASKSIRIVMDLSVPSLTVVADRVRLKQVLYNLLSNAVKFTPASGEVKVSVISRGAYAEVSVSDTGIGIPEDQYQVIFDKFYQVRSSTKSGSEGTGLGLAITKRLVEQHGGTIWLSSVSGQGSCFSFTLAQAREDGPSGTPRNTHERGAESREHAGPC